MDNSTLGDVKYDWYQNESHVVISVMLKQMQPENVSIVWTEKSLTCTARLPDDKECCLHLDLAHEICQSQSTWKILSSKVEIKLQKLLAIRWSSLISEEEPKDNVSLCPKSSVTQKIDWNKLELQVKKEEEEEKLEGDAALNQMFQKIYSEGTDETKRAMNKSFFESGGTVLSTNWKEVVEKKVDVKPPDGMEWKQWTN